MATAIYTWFTRPVGLEGLRDGLSRYKYVSPNKSFAEALFLVDFWNWFAKKFYPAWLAPNMITFLGVVAQLITLLLLVYYSPEINGQTPAWWLPLAAVAGMFYQTMDGTDGVQARQTKSGSPMGELFDHGVDAISTTIYTLMVIEWSRGGLLLRASRIAILAGQMAFAAQTVSMHHTDEFLFDHFDCQESQLAIQSLLLLKYFFPGSENIPFPQPSSSTIFRFYKRDVYGFHDEGLVFWQVICMIPTTMLLLNVLRNYVRAIRHHATSKTQGIKEGQTLSGFFQQLLVHWSYWGMTLLAWHEMDRVIELRRVSSDIAIYFVLSAILGFASLMWRYLVMRIAGEPYAPFYLQPALHIMLGWWLWFVFGSTNPTILRAGCLVLFSLSLVAFLSYATRMSHAICKVLGIYFFDITKKRPVPKAKDS